MILADNKDPEGPLILASNFTVMAKESIQDNTF